jgi:hypothetical protein
MPPSARALVGTSGSGNPASVRTDDLGFLMMSPFSNDFIAQGKLFYIYDSALLAVLRTFHIAVGANPIDMKFNVAAGLSTPVTLQEGVTAGSGGTAVSVLNFNRNSANTINLTVTLNKGSVTGGIEVFASSAGFGTLAPASSNVQSAMAEKSNYWKLKANTNYLLSYTPGASVLTSMNATFYENLP